ncbi:MAG: tRNA (N6-threonylcarbamoyladenosine(37)-N6)-methyltransferase TrmO [Sphaerochaetaceae bacterium]|nr:tRNA (N6-threonylcarbamoyladenosine(37)-N6)-methyltransferase TrmO [Sphaerochaetaceae bacterium]
MALVSPISMKIIARMHSDFPTKFGIPRQSGLAEDLRSIVVFEPEFRNPDAVRGLEEFSHIWLIWQFSESLRETWSPTVRPPRLGGSVRKGVFATRSPFRPNGIGLSSVKLDSIEMLPELGPVLHVSGADLMDGTPIFDVKPYLPFVDGHPDATGGFADRFKDYSLQVVFPEELLALVPSDHRQALVKVLSLDPRPSYQNDPSRVYGMSFAGLDIRFVVHGEILSVVQVVK